MGSGSACCKNTEEGIIQPVVEQKPEVHLIKKIDDFNI